MIKSNDSAVALLPPLSGSGLDAWACDYPDTRESLVAASEWEGKTVIQRPDGGGFPLEPGVVKLDPRSLHARDPGWFWLVTERHPDGISCHTQECYPPEFTGCSLPCCQNAQADPRPKP